MPNNIVFNPARDLGPRTTASSASEGRLRVSTGRRKKRKLLKGLLKSVADGQGGHGKKKY